MSIVINGNGTITGLAVGGLPDGIVDTDMLANNAVATGKIADNAVTSAKSSGLGGLAMADEWRVDADMGENNNTVISAWERNDTNFSGIGTGMTESSGVFTFPATGIYKVEFYATSRRAANQALPYVRYWLQLSSDSGSNYNSVAMGSTQMGTGGDNQECFCAGTAIVDITNASTFRIQLYLAASTHVRPLYGSGTNHTTMTFLKLGDT
tara:strand:+ start:525 stop:1151 length:627 start_codon:yes stop_codon:yes gene_type:complete